jgi:cell wall-associated NlpC family hydrolase
MAEGYVGVPYVWGGSSPRGFDCSGLVKHVYGHFGIVLDHDAAAALAVGEPVATEALLPGDVLVFQNTYRFGPSHAGIYLGNGQFVHALNESKGVLISNLDDSYWESRFYGAARLLPTYATSEDRKLDAEEAQIP